MLFSSRLAYPSLSHRHYNFVLSSFFFFIFLIIFLFPAPFDNPLLNWMQNNISNISNFNFNFNFLKSTTWAYYIRYSHTKTDNIFLPFIYIMIWCNDSQTLPTRFHSIRFVLFYFIIKCFASISKLLLKNPCFLFISVQMDIILNISSLWNDFAFFHGIG